MSRITTPLLATDNLLRVPLEPKRVKRSGPRLKRTRLRKAGRKVKEWNAIRAVLKVRFQASSITTCELNLDGCFHDNCLGFMHTKKRRNCTEADLWIVALSCNSCHDQWEMLPESEMGEKVFAIIAARSVQP